MLQTTMLSGFQAAVSFMQTAADPTKSRVEVSADLFEVDLFKYSMTRVQNRN